MHNSVYWWIESKVEEFDLSCKEVLEVGSRNVNGTVKYFFLGTYIGIDMVPGVEVDIVARADNLPFDDERFDVVICTEMLEHDPYFWKSIQEMWRVLRWDGLLLLTTRGIGFPLHEYPSDYWRFTNAAILHLLTDSKFSIVELTDDPQEGHPGIFAIGRKAS